MLEIKSLRVAFGAADGRQALALNGLSLTLRAGEALAIVGESGSGKTTLARAALRLLPPAASVSGSIRFRSTELLTCGRAELRRVRGEKIALIAQSADRALDPLLRTRDQVAEVIRSHRKWPRRRCREEADHVLRRLFDSDAPRLGDAWPHQLSGGERQRAVLAQALACSPEILIADEPTASLDTVTQRDVLDLLRAWSRQPGNALLFITHDPAAAASISQRVEVMYAGQIVESGPTAKVLDDPLHPFTRMLLRCRPEAGFGRDVLWPVIPGPPHDASRPHAGCAFLARCDRGERVCAESAPPPQEKAGRRIRCFRAGHD